MFSQRLWPAELDYLRIKDVSQLSRWEAYDTSGYALIIACRRVLCGSSVYDQKNWSSPWLACVCSGRSNCEEGCKVVVTNAEGIAGLRNQCVGRMS